MTDYLIVTHRVANPIGLATLESLVSRGLANEKQHYN